MTLLLSLTACFLSLEPLDARIDADGDGALALHVEGGTDCDDSDPAISPSAAELCDDIDHDCDGADGQTLDADGDGSPQCRDCNDADPGAAEERTFWTDADGDGLGDADQPAGTTCSPPDGAVANDEDCDDSRDDVPNTVRREVCDDGHDNDCDGTIDACNTYDLANPDARWTANDHEASGAGLTLEEDLTGNGYADLMGAAPGAAILVEVQRMYLVEGPGRPSMGADDAVMQVTGSSGRPIGKAMAGGDFTGDGVPDWAAVLSPSSFYSSEIVVMPGPLTGAHSSEAGIVIRPDNLGFANASLQLAAGDFDGDGVRDLAVGAPMDPPGSGTGRVYLVPGPITEDVDLGDGPFAVMGYEALRVVANAGDTDGDGIDELVIADPNADGDEGIVGLVRAGDIVGTGVPISELSFILQPSGSGANDLGLGALLGDGTDLDGDGLDEIIAASSATSNLAVQSVYVVSPTLSEGTVGPPLFSNTAAGELLRLKADAVHDIHGVPDIDGDGIGELVIGGEEGGDSMGWLVYGGTTGILPLSSLNSGAVTDPTGVRFSAPSGARLTVGGGGDMDGDGIPDIAFGVHGHGGAGWVAVFYGWPGSWD